MFKENQFVVNIRKCSCGKEQIEYIGQILLRDSVSADLTKAKSVLDWPVPKNMKRST